MFAKRSGTLFTACLLGLAYTVFLSIHFFGEVSNGEAEAASGIFALALIFPHIISLAAATFLCILAFLLNVRWLAIVAGISFVVAAALVLLYGLFVLPMIVLCFIGAATMGKIQMAEHHKMTEDVLQDMTGEDGRFRGKIFGGFHRKDVLSHMQTLYGETEQLKREKLFYREQAEELQYLLQTIEDSLSTMDSLAHQQEGALPVQRPKAAWEEKPVLQAEPVSIPMMEEKMIEEIREEIKDIPDGEEITLTEALLPETSMEQPYFTLESAEEGTFGAPPFWSTPQDIVEPEHLSVVPEEPAIVSTEEIPHMQEPAPVVEEEIPHVQEPVPVMEEEIPAVPKLRPTLSNPYPGQGVQRVKVRKV